MIGNTYHQWRNIKGKYQDIEGFCKSATIDEVIKHNYVLMAGNYVGTEEVESDGISFEEKMQTLTTTLAKQFTKRRDLEKNVRKNLTNIGYEL